MSGSALKDINSVNMKKYISAALLLSPVAVSASNVDANIFTRNNLVNYIAGISNWFAGILMALAVVVALYGAFLFVTAADNEDKVSKAKNALLGSLAIIAIAMLAFGVKTILVSFLT